MLDLIFETSWEVCNKVGGIYAVLSTKAKTLQKKYRNKVIFVGPDVWSAGNASPFFVETPTLYADWACNGIHAKDVAVRVGYWDIPGKPVVFLVDYKKLYSHKNNLYAEMWRRYGVDSLHGYGDYDESCMFAYGAALIIESFVNWHRQLTGDIIAHFDEWTTGMGLLYLKIKLPHVATIFTTHATSIGRSICGNGKPLYDYMKGYNGDQMAGELNMQSKQSLEKAAAHHADVFTTVSEVTARECEQLLGIRPLVTPNGFERNFVPKGAAYEAQRSLAREKMFQVAESLTGIEFDADTMIIGTSGRCEFRNKGIDVYLDSMNMLRDIISCSKRPSRLLAFVFVPAWCDQARADLQGAIKAGSVKGLFNPVITHTVHDPESDIIYNKINYLGFRNDISSNVSVIYVPCYLNGKDGIFDMTYYELLAGLDLTIFPSYYEPWGYTPLESMAFGVPTVTTDLSGYGQWILDTFGRDYKISGAKVIHRTDFNYDSVLSSIIDVVEDIRQMKPTDIKTLRRAATTTSKKASWEEFMQYYYNAYEIAVQRSNRRIKGL
ncbi:MAG: glycogen/starch synthase [Muribaculaceae bacterium]|nr:glycogen/starch synthase [Muribaculaceae bacterium]